MMKIVRPWLLHWKLKGPQYVLVLAVVSALYLAGQTGLSQYQGWRLGRAPASDWVEYHDVRFLGEDPTRRGGLGILRMESETTIHKPVLMNFIDILKCERSPGLVAAALADDPNADIGPVMERISQNVLTSSFQARARERSVVPWPYEASYIRGRACRVESTIVLDIEGGERKTIEVSTALFELSE